MISSYLFSKILGTASPVDFIFSVENIDLELRYKEGMALRRKWLILP